MKVGGGIVPEIGVRIGGDAEGVHGGEVYGVPFGGTVGNIPTSEPIDALR